MKYRSASCLLLVIVVIAGVSCWAVNWLRRDSVTVSVVGDHGMGGESAELIAFQDVNVLREIAEEDIDVGQEGQEVHQLLTHRGLELMFMDLSSVDVVRFYGTGHLGDPVLKVTLRKSEGLLYVTEVHVEP